jgi:outer membrane protein assembly factor BamB
MGRPLVATLATLAALLSAPALAASPAGSAPAPVLTEVAFLTSSSAHSPTAWQGFDSTDRAAWDFLGDGKPDLVLSNDNLRHYVIDPRQGIVLAELDTAHPYGETWGGRELDSPAVGDVFGDGGSEIAIENGQAELTLYRFSAQNSTPTSFAFDKLWENHTDARAWDPNFAQTHPWNDNGSPTSEGHPFLADVDGSGQETVFSNAQDVSTAVAFWPNGTLRWWADPPSDPNAGVIVADLNGDGRHEAIFATDGGVVYTYDAQTGKALWNFDTRCTNGVWQGNGSNCDYTQPSSISVTPTVVDLFGDGKKEVCFGSRWLYANISDPSWWSDNNATVQSSVDASHAKLWCVTHGGKQLWVQQQDWFNPHVQDQPVPFDVNGDGVRDLIFIDWNSIGHKPGNWQTTTRGPNLMALDGKTGNVLWNTTLASGWSNKMPVLVDLYGDGRQELIAEEYGPTGDDGLGVFDPHTGQRFTWYPLQHGWGATRGPMAVDLWGDGYMELVVPLARGVTDPNYCPEKRADLPCREGALEVLATHKAYSSQFRDVFTWDQKGDAHVFDAAPATASPTSAPTAWPNEANAPFVRPYGQPGAIPPTPVTPASPTLTTPTLTTPAPNATTPSTTPTVAVQQDATPTESRSASPPARGVPTAEIGALLPAFAAAALAFRRRSE